MLDAFAAECSASALFHINKEFQNTLMAVVSVIAFLHHS